MKRGFLRGERVVDPRCVCWWLQTCRPLSSPCGRFPPEALSPGCSYCGMETHAFWLVQLFLFTLWGAHQQVIVCNESLMLEKLPRCGKSFEEMMKKVDSKKWCNLTEFIPITLTSGPQKTSHVRQIWIEKGLTKQRYNTGR
ncbi:receptor activity-modifying protein 3 isoform X2 [Trachemys scripta elegans]|uniref:receptor activity-modifying protein 3 isoform X2 n=1 Tax=Trachemys scripta elegans TaxID=31138 RepID=UPI001557817D|nr:receptor activity-modifying protein 3 isoform X2 [Trachemys scripta elegans]